MGKERKTEQAKSETPLRQNQKNLIYISQEYSYHPRICLLPLLIQVPIQILFSLLLAWPRIYAYQQYAHYFDMDFGLILFRICRFVFSFRLFGNRLAGP